MVLLCGFLYIMVRGQCLHLSLGQPAYVCLSIVLCGAYMLVCVFVCAHVCKVHVCCVPSACQRLLPLQRSVWMEHVLSALWSSVFFIPPIHGPPLHLSWQRSLDTSVASLMHTNAHSRCSVWGWVFTLHYLFILSTHINWIQNKIGWAFYLVP